MPDERQGFEESVAFAFTKRDARAARGPAYARALSSIPVDRQPDAEKRTPETEWRRNRDIWGSLEVIRDVLLSIVEDFERAKMFDAIAYLQRVGGAAQERTDPAFTDNPLNPVTDFPNLIKTLGGSLTFDRRDIDAIYVLINGLVPYSLIDAKGDLLAGTAADTLSRLGVGSNGQVLTADSTQPTGLKWAAAGVTDHGALTGLGDDDHPQYILVAGTRAFTGDQSMGSHKLTNVTDPTSAQDAATKAYADLMIPKSLVDAKGDLLAGTADNTVARVAIGSNTTILMADSTQTPGLKWAAQSLIDHGSIGGLADDDHTQYTRKDTLTTKGDLYAATAASTPARVAVGANKRALVADSSVSAGVAYGGAVNQFVFNEVSTVTGNLWDGAWAQAALTTLAVTSDRLYAYPVWIPRPVSVDRIGYEVTTASAGAGKVRLGIYKANAENDPIPTTLVQDSGEFSGADVESTGMKMKTVAWTITEPGLYWLAFVNGTSPPTVRALAPGAIMPILGMDSAGNSRSSGFIRVFTYAALPDPWGTPNVRALAMPQVFLRFASVS